MLQTQVQKWLHAHRHTQTHTYVDTLIWEVDVQLVGISPYIAVGGSSSFTFQESKTSSILAFFFQLFWSSVRLPFGVGSLSHCMFNFFSPSSSSPPFCRHAQSSRCSLSCDPFSVKPSVFHRSPIRSWCYTSSSPFKHFHNTLLLTSAYRMKWSCQQWMRLTVFHQSNECEVFIRAVLATPRLQISPVTIWHDFFVVKTKWWSWKRAPFFPPSPLRWRISSPKAKMWTWEQQN